MRFTQSPSRSALAIALVLLLASACTHSSNTGSQAVSPSAPRVQTLTAQAVNSTIVPKGTIQLISGPMNSTISVMNAGKGKDAFFFQAQASLSPDNFAKLKQQGGVKAVAKAINDSFAKLKSIGAIPIKAYPEVGYFSIWIPYQTNMMGALKSVVLPAEFYVNPTHIDINSMKQMQEHTAQSMGFTPRAGKVNKSGLNLLHAPDFVKLVQASLPGVQIDGSSSKVGITDTGITYNHPTFLASDVKTPRIAYMKDFSGEGRIYFNPAAKFSATLTDDASNAFTLQAQYTATPKLPSLADPTALVDVKDLQITVSDELKAVLQDSSKKVALSYLSEDDFQGGENPVDINANGSSSDMIPVLLVTDASGKSVVYADFSVSNDFSKSVAQADFNSGGAAAKVFAEKIAFHIQDDELVLPDQSGTLKLKSASIVGFDPGPHGTHVAGIAAGRKTISNDSDDTLARGVAPAATILSDRVCANNGGCQAMEAAIDLAVNGNVDVINMSLGGSSPFNDGYGVDETIVNRLASVYNVMFMISAGNEGPGRQTIGSPSTARFALSIGASASRALIQSQYQWPGVNASSSTDPTADEFMLYFSSRGPTANGGFKPNISAPGTELSSISLNSAPGTRSGLDVYWGTSMAAPAATGSYALLLDAIRKFNAKNADSPMPTDVATLRSVLVQSARKIGAPGEFTWMDQGTGVIDLVAAWNILLDLRAEKISSGVADAKGNNVALDYEVLTSLTNPTGQVYDGSRKEAVDPSGATVPAFGAGIYVNFYDTRTLSGVYVQRRLPETLLASESAGDLSVALETSAEEFVLKTDFGGDEAWVKPGVLQQPNCMDSDTANLNLIGRGNEVQVAADGSGELNPLGAANLYVCIDRAKIAAMSAGDHGALIYAYKTDGTNVSKVPSFVVPVALTIPNRTLADSTAYDINATAQSFEVSHNYVTIPKGATLARVTLEVPQQRSGDQCSEVLLMPLEGDHMTPPPADLSLLATNCSSNGVAAPDASRTVVMDVPNPKGGVWDLPVFGIYMFPVSHYRLRVDYVMSSVSVSAITGDSSKLSGSFEWKLGDSSLTTAPDATKSSYNLNGLYHRENSKVKKGQDLAVGGPLGQFRSYPAGTLAVAIDTGGSTGNDIDLTELECDTAGDVSSCAAIAQSGTPTDVEHVSFVPKAGKFYVAVVSGYAISDSGNFFCDERISLAAESGTLAINSDGDKSDSINYSLSSDAVSSSALLSNPLATSKQYQIFGSIVLRSTDGIVLGNVPLTIGL